MKIHTILSACNLNHTYISFVPYFIRAWKSVLKKANVVIYVIGDKIPTPIASYSENLRLLSLPPEISTVFASQFSRLLLPAIEKSEGVLVSDIDMLPLSRRYFEDSIADIPDDAFIVYRDVLESVKQTAICYNCAAPDVWGDIFNIKTKKNVIDLLAEVQKSIAFDAKPSENCWFTDQLQLYERLKSWENNGNKVVRLNDENTGFQRLDRCDITEWKSKLLKHSLLPSKLKSDILKGTYSDYHAGRPWEAHREVNNEILRLLEYPTVFERLGLSVSNFLTFFKNPSTRFYRRLRRLLSTTK
jgi:hypothetical protein